MLSKPVWTFWWSWNACLSLNPLPQTPQTYGFWKKNNITYCKMTIHLCHLKLGMVLKVCLKSSVFFCLPWHFPCVWLFCVGRMIWDFRRIHKARKSSFDGSFHGSWLGEYLWTPGCSPARGKGWLCLQHYTHLCPTIKNSKKTSARRQIMHTCSMHHLFVSIDVFRSFSTYITGLEFSGFFGTRLECTDPPVDFKLHGSFEPFNAVSTFILKSKKTFWFQLIWWGFSIENSMYINLVISSSR